VRNEAVMVMPEIKMAIEHNMRITVTVARMPNAKFVFFTNHPRKLIIRLLLNRTVRSIYAYYLRFLFERQAVFYYLICAHARIVKNKTVL